MSGMIHLKLDRRGGALDGVVDLEEFHVPETEQPGHQIGGKNLDPCVQVAHVGVVESARGLDPVLGVDQFLLQRPEVAAGLEVRVTLGDRQQRAQRVISPAPVAGLDVELAAELGRLEVDVVQADELADLVEESFGANEQVLERSGELDMFRSEIKKPLSNVSGTGSKCFRNVSRNPVKSGRNQSGMKVLRFTIDPPQRFGMLALS